MRTVRVLFQRTRIGRHSRYGLYIRHVLLGRPVERERRMRMLQRGNTAGRRRRGGDVRTEILVQNIGNLLHGCVRPRRTRVPLIHKIGRIDDGRRRLHKRARTTQRRNGRHEHAVAAVFALIEIDDYLGGRRLRRQLRIRHGHGLSFDVVRSYFAVDVLRFVLRRVHGIVDRFGFRAPHVPLVEIGWEMRDRVLVMEMRLMMRRRLMVGRNDVVVVVIRRHRLGPLVIRGRSRRRRSRSGVRLVGETVL